MKKIILSVLVITISLSAFAQRGAIELGIGGGVSTNSNPSLNMAFTGNAMTVNYAGVFNALYNVHRNVAVGIEVRMAELSRVSKDSTYYYSFLKSQIGGNDKRFVYSKMAISACIVGNGKLNVKRGYVYGGVALGYGVTRHDSKIKTRNEAYRAPDGSRGRVLGLQGGYTYGITSAVALNFEGALRNYRFANDAIAPEIRPYEDLDFRITSYALTIGLKVRIMPKYGNQNDIPAFRGGGRSAQPIRPKNRPQKRRRR